MKIDYIRKLTASYMVLEQEGEAASWEEQMIAHVKGRNIIFAEHVRENGEKQLWYDITGKQSLDSLLESEEIGFDLLCGILDGMYSAVEDLEDCLLWAEGLLLCPECIFVDYRTGGISFCYNPGRRERITEAFVSLLELFLTKLNHKEEDAVELAYAVYEQAVLVKGEGSLGVWKRLLRLPYEREGAREEKEQACEQAEEIAEETDKAAGRDGEQYRIREQEEKKTNMPKENAGRSLTSAKGWREAVSERMRRRLPAEGSGWAFVREKCMARFGSGEKKRQGRLRLLDGFRLPGGFGLPERKEEKEIFVFEPEEEEEHPTSHPTVLISEINHPPEGILRYEGANGNQDLVIDGEVYLIGSGPECDGVIGSATVSRKHARITRKGDVYFVEDMNSSNGTYVGGRMLNYRTKTSLQKNEIVVFADEKFRFI